MLLLIATIEFSISTPESGSIAIAAPEVDAMLSASVA
jgi:hypothetical protein